MTGPTANPLGSDDVTLEAVADESAAPAPCRVHLVTGSDTDASHDALLQSRLRMAALVLFIGLVAFLVWRSLGLLLGTFDLAQPMALLEFPTHAVLTLLVAAHAFSLCRNDCHGLTTRQLRVRELTLFGLLAAFLLLVEYNSLTIRAARDGYVPSPVGVWLLLIFTYAMFIPNTWQRAMAVVGPMAAAPVVLMGVLWLVDPACAAAFQRDVNLPFGVALTMAVAAVAAVVGVHTINTLRSAALQARQLGQYRLRQLLGRGGMGEVYLAEHQLMKRPCAIKIIRPERMGDARALARFEREVHVVARLSHWNSIDIYDYGRADDGTFYYVMEYLPGMSLQELVARHGPLPAGRVVYLLSQTCEALAEAHQEGIVHRDIKPANIFASVRGAKYDVAKLLDFGLAKPLISDPIGDLTQENVITGSPLYMSPEQAAGDGEPDARSDIYSLGAVAYFLLSGVPPFPHDRAIKVMMDHVHQPPRPPSELRPDVPPDLEQTVLRCLAKPPAERYQSALELYAALGQCQSAADWDADAAAQWWHQQVHGQATEPEWLEPAGRSEGA